MTQVWKVDSDSIGWGPKSVLRHFEPRSEVSLVRTVSGLSPKCRASLFNPRPAGLPSHHDNLVHRLCCMFCMSSPSSSPPVISSSSSSAHANQRVKCGPCSLVWSANYHALIRKPYHWHPRGVISKKKSPISFFMHAKNRQLLSTVA